MKRYFTFMLLSFCLLGISAFADDLEVRVGEWAPLYYLDDGEWVGTNVDAYKALCREAEIDLIYKNLPWSRAMANIKTRPLVVAQLSRTKEREEYMHFIGPHAYEEMRLIVHKKYVDRPINSLDDLVALIKETGKQVAYQQDTFYSEEFNRRINEDPEFKKCFLRSSMLTTLIQMVEAGRLLGFLDDKLYWLYKSKTSPRELPLSLHPFVIGKSEVYFGVSRTVESEIVDKLKEANKRLLTNNTYEKINEKWSNWLQR